MDKVDIASSILAARHNKTEIPDEVKEAVNQVISNDDIDERVKNTAEALCNRLNKGRKVVNETVDDSEDSPVNQALRKWVKRVNSVLEKNNSKKLANTTLIEMFLDGVTAKEAASILMKHAKKLREEKKKGILAILKGAK